MSAAEAEALHKTFGERSTSAKSGTCWDFLAADGNEDGYIVGLRIADSGLRSLPPYLGCRIGE